MASKRHLRAVSVIKIQCQMRRYLSNKAARDKKKKFMLSALAVQRIFRGWRWRNLLKRHAAAKTLQRAFRKLKSRRFFVAVLAIIACSKILRHREICISKIQSFCRGYLTRLHIYRYRQKLFFKFNCAALIMQKFFNRFRKAKMVVAYRKVSCL